MSDVFDLGVPGPSGNENDTYVSNDIIYKVNNLLNSGSILRLLDRVMWHNNLFYDTAYSLYGFTMAVLLCQYYNKSWYKRHCQQHR